MAESDGECGGTVNAGKTGEPVSLMAGLGRHILRMVAVVLMVTVGSAALVRFAPGYLSDARELDPRYAAAARNELSTEAERSGSFLHLIRNQFGGWSGGTLGISREYGVPVVELIRPRLAVSGALVMRGIVLAWMVALCGACISSLVRKPSLLAQMPAALLLAMPTAAMATVCLLVNTGGPLLVLVLVIAARDFKFIDRILRKAWSDPHLLHARAQGMTWTRMAWAHILPGIAPQLLALASLSMATALGALVPVEVIFNAAGLGSLAWSAAQNRDIPVLVAVTMIMAISVTLTEFGWNRADLSSV
jgi:peptide/nickel transport system permease protein